LADETRAGELVLISRQHYEKSLLRQFRIREQKKKVISCELCLKSAKIRYHYFKPTGGTEKRPLYKHYWVCAGCDVERGEHKDD
jgi:hypothetical protein